MDERRLEELYRNLAAGDGEVAPSFAAVMGRARRRHGVRLPALIAFGFAAVVTLFVVVPRGRTPQVVSAREPAPPLEFLLQEGRVAGVPAFDLEPRTALSRSVPPGFE